jgi:pre-mRNA cleavage complex 2 protein Pcf11
MRFQDSSVGKKKMEDHLDMHFRQNRKASQNIGRGHSRSWFIALEVRMLLYRNLTSTDVDHMKDWIHDVPDAKGKGRADRQLGSKAAAAEEQAKREAELRALYVVVPPGDEARSIACPVCKEFLKSEFLEDDEEWVWKNAIKKEDRVRNIFLNACGLLNLTFLTDIPRDLSCRSSVLNK